MVEVQPCFKDRIQNLEIGILCRTSSSQENYTFTVGYHELSGTKMKLKKPYLVLKKTRTILDSISDDEEEDNSKANSSKTETELDVIGIIRYRIPVQNQTQTPNFNSFSQDSLKPIWTGSIRLILKWLKWLVLTTASLFTQAYTCGSVDVKFDGSLANVPHHEHVLVFEGNHFTVNGGPERDPNDPCNAELLESVKNYKIPEEFAADGMHTVRVVRTCKSFSNVEVVRDKRLDEYYRLMSCKLNV